MQICKVDDNKIELTKSIKPNAIHNRYDLLFGNNYDLFEISDENFVIYIPFKKIGTSGRLALYLRNINDFNLDISEISSYLFKTYPDLHDIFVLHTYTHLPDVNEGIHWHIELLSTIEEFDSNLSSKVRYNTKWYPKKIRENIGEYEIKILTTEECPEYIVETYLKWKKKTYNFNWEWKPKEYLLKNGITKVYVMLVNNEILSIGFICETGDNAFYENTAFNETYKRYSVGIVLYHFIIADLIKNIKKILFLLGGDLEYKRNYNGIKTMTYTGYIYKDPEMHKKVLNIAEKIKRFPFSKKSKKRIASIYGRIFLSKYYKQFLKSEVIK